MDPDILEISPADKDALLARYAAAQALIEEALVACETRMLRTAIQKTWHAVQDVRKLDAELERLKILPVAPRPKVIPIGSQP